MLLNSLPQATLAFFACLDFDGLLHESGKITWEEDAGDQVADDRGNADAYQSWHHEAVVQQILADDGGA